MSHPQNITIRTWEMPPRQGSPRFWLAGRKYVVFHRQACTMIVFPADFTHLEIAERFGIHSVCSAGFTTLEQGKIVCTGYSASILKAFEKMARTDHNHHPKQRCHWAREEDTQAIQEYLNNIR